MPSPRHPTGRRDGEAGQMMLLSAVLLIFAFLALSATVARVAQLGSVTTRDQDRPLLLEIDVVQSAVDEAISGLTGTAGMCPAGTCKQTFVDALGGSMSHIAFLEASRGFDFEWRMVDTTTGATVTACGAGTRAVELTLDDSEIQVEVRSTATFTYACP